MKERELRALIEKVREGKVERRAFIQRMVGLGLTAPMASMMLMHEGIAQTAPAMPAYKPTKRGGGGPLKVIYWQAAVHLNPHYAGGTKDQDASRVFYEPLASWDSEGNLVPVLAASIPKRYVAPAAKPSAGKGKPPSAAAQKAAAEAQAAAESKAELDWLWKNGGVSRDGSVVVWKLKRDVKWHDGKPFTADDVVFTAQYASDPAAAMTTVSVYKNIKVNRLDSHTVRIEFDKPTPFWAEPFVGSVGLILPKHVFEGYMGAKSRENPANLKAVGTGPYKIVDFKPGDMLRAAANMDYHVPNQPFFDTLEIKGGGDATSAARAVLQTAEYDVGWNLAVEDVILKQLEGAGKGKMSFFVGSDIEFVILNPTDPWNEVDGERGSDKSKHPAFTDKAVRDAMNLLIDRKGIADVIYGRGAITTANFLNNPPRFRSANMKFEFNPAKAEQILEAAGWKKGSDGIRAKGNVKLKFVYQTSVSGPRQKCQA
ncbi:MAG: peptide ABC transporter substrate-binding protein, partial [Rubrivivax sp.]|nr:peptide ABC transporter substrate-binding protein [Rubrivivax sp.]